MLKNIVIIASVIALSLSFALSSHAADAWQRWTKSADVQTIHVDHSAWSIFLDTYVKTDQAGLNRVDYAHVTASDHAALKAYITMLEAIDVDALTVAQQKAYWINFYNAGTLDIILDNYPLATIRDIDRSLFARGPWRKKYFRIDGEEISLDDIEHRILRPIYKDNRVHYGVNCASIGCPNLARTAYTAQTINQMLEANAIAYINSGRGLKLSGKKIILSRIYDWFREDFGGNEAGVIAHLRKYAQGARADALNSRVQIDKYVYDWSLNEIHNRQGGDN